MKIKLGRALMALGAACFLAGVGLLLFNAAQAKKAEQAVMEVIPELVEEITQKREEAEKEAILPELVLDPANVEMTEVTIKGHSYIGYLTIDDLVLPILSDWSYKKLQIAPCRYTGNLRSNDLVLMAHNYPKHFGKLSDLRWGDSVTFTDMDGVVTKYTVVSRDILDPSAVEEMTAGNFDLTLFTCTYGGKSRVTVYCDRVEYTAE